MCGRKRKENAALCRKGRPGRSAKIGDFAMHHEPPVVGLTIPSEWPFGLLEAVPGGISAPSLSISAGIAHFAGSDPVGAAISASQSGDPRVPKSEAPTPPHSSHASFPQSSRFSKVQY